MGNKTHLVSNVDLSHSAVNSNTTGLSLFYVYIGVFVCVQ